MTEINPTALLSDIVVFSKYAKYLPELGRRETWSEICERNMNMHIKKYPNLADDITHIYKTYVETKKVFPSMRSLQFGGVAIEKNNSRMFNCSYMAIDDIKSFSEGMFLLLGGTGLGISVQERHINKLQKLVGPKRRRTKLHIIEDSIMGWADAVKVLVSSYFKNKMQVRFDFSDIRPKGAPLVTAGGKAPGPGPLKVALTKIENILDEAIEERGSGTKLKPIEAFDIMCFIADAVLSGGIRRSAMITLFSKTDNEMLEAKGENWYNEFPHRGNSNNSVAFLRSDTSKEDFNRFWEQTVSSGWGEPGFTWSNNLDYGINPCAEVSLVPSSFCNLTTVIVSDVSNQTDLNLRVCAASFLGTLQAGYTDFHYLSDNWQDETEEDALIGVSMTGIASGNVLKFDLREASDWAVTANRRAAESIGIKKAKRVTVIKPEGTSSLVAGCSSGIHAYHAPYYIRRMRFNKEEPLYKYLYSRLGGTRFLEDCQSKPSTVGILALPIKAPDGSIFRDESPMELLARVQRFQDEWIAGGHREGDNRNNVSVTVSVKDDEWDDVGKWMWENNDKYTGISVLNYNGGNFPQMPFEDIDEETYGSMLEELEKYLGGFDITKVEENDDNVAFGASVACGGGACEITGV